MKITVEINKTETKRPIKDNKKKTWFFENTQN